MNTDHYAILFGLSYYPKLGKPQDSLNGPEIDVRDVKSWLVYPGPGGIPAGNVKTICSSNYNAPPDAAPTRDTLQATFLWLNSLAKLNQEAGKGSTVGARLYLYASGHGFSPGVHRGCLLAGDTDNERVDTNVYPSAWIEWLQDAGYFREFVLWMDCCMDRKFSTLPTPPPLPRFSVSAPSGPSFIAFAAERPLKAVETQIVADRGNWHGVFTWNLLEGLRGAAANSFGKITGRSLSDWLRQSQLGWLDDNDKRDPSVSKEPSIVDDDARLVFARGVAQFDFAVTLRFPGNAVGKSARLWSGSPPKPGTPFPILENTPLLLKPGLYLVDVPDQRLRQGFAVTRSEDIALSETGEPPIEAPGAIFQLEVNPTPRDPTADIRVVGDGFRLVDSATGSLATPLPYGLYGIRIRVGRQIVEKVILLDGNWPKTGTSEAAFDELPPSPPITSAAPLPGTRATHEYQREAAQDARVRFDVHSGDGAELMVMARNFSAGHPTGPQSRPWEGLIVLDSFRQPVADLSVTGEHQDTVDSVGVCSLSLSPGAYFLRDQSSSAGPVDQSLFVPPGGWRLEAYVLRENADADDSGACPSVSVLMRRIGAPWGTDEDVLLEKARVALADERPVLNEELSELLLRKFDNPIAGIIGGHLLAIEQEAGLHRDPDLLNVVVRNLRALVGDDHPDVEALSLLCPNTTLRRQNPIIAPPIFERSWRIIVRASQTNPELVSPELWTQVHAGLATPPFLSWSSNEQTQWNFRRALARAAFGSVADDRSTFTPSVLLTPVTDLPMTPRAHKALRNADIKTVHKLVELTEQDLLGVKNFGYVSLLKVKEALAHRGLSLGMRRRGGVSGFGRGTTEILSGPESQRTFSLDVNPQLSERYAEELGLPPIGLQMLWSEFRPQMSAVRVFAREQEYPDIEATTTYGAKE